MTNDVHTSELYMDELGFVPNNNRFKVLSKNGFKDFIGVKRTLKKTNMLILYIGKHIYIKVTQDHKVFISENEYKTASEFKIGDLVHTNKGVLPVLHIKESTSESTYDLLHVEDDHCFYIKSGDSQILTHQCLYIDELGFLPAAEEFYESVYPTISSSDTSKVIITSTPKGLNFFYKMWVEAERCESDYIAYDVKWYEHPDRDQKWYDTQCANLNAKSVDQEINCVAADTLINIAGEGDVTIESIYNKYAKFHTTKAGVIYISDISIGAK